MRFSANISMLFTEAPFLERFEGAAEAGFSAVEFWWPLGASLDLVEAAARSAGVDVVLFNFLAGDMAAGDRGLLADPDRQHEFRENVPVALDLAQRLGCSRLNALVGLERPGLDPKVQLDLAVHNLRWAADQAVGAGISVLVEAVNRA
ncbi:MAG: TIM barrel protein, partial [Chloroflexota bacterium]|nr:TIM barrel protein [Chloroflexota bacterium]